MGAAIAAPILAGGLQGALGWLRSKRDKRVEHTMERATSEAGLSEEELLQRLLASEAGQELLINALNAAQDAVFDKKAEAIASALARGALAGTVEAVKLEDLFVRTLASMDLAHFEVLEVFEEREAQASDRPLRSDELVCDRTLLRERLPALGVGVDAVIALLQREGVIAMVQRPGNPFQAEEAKWALTDYGRSFVGSLRLAGEQLNADEGEGRTE
jgi:hypothetical protein